jgi:uncharacterized protein (DUF1800 family)
MAPSTVRPAYRLFAKCRIISRTNDQPGQTAMTAPFRTAAPLLAVFALLAGCAAAPAGAPPRAYGLPAASLLPVLNRVSWGASTATWRAAQAEGIDRYLDRQLHPAPDDGLPPAVAAQIREFDITKQPMDELVIALERQRKEFDAIPDEADRKAARQAYQEGLNRLAKQAAARSLLRDVYSHNQLQEQMTWFWVNHFSVHQGKQDLRAMVGDYEDRAIRPHALGKFRDLVRATVFHPAMLRYLDNAQNHAGHINENYARELMELHTLGVGGGYTQADVQELARILTGLGVNLGAGEPKIRRQLQDQYLRRGLVEFNPARHDYGDKVLLGQPVRGAGLAEIDAAISRLCAHPATARHVSRKLALFFTGADPSPRLEGELAERFQRTDGDIAQVLAALFAAPEFRQSLGAVFRDPVHYVVASVRMAYDDRPILNATPMANWLNRLGEPLYGRQTPDGYPLQAASWQSAGQMTMRFEIAKTIGAGSAGLFRVEGEGAKDRPAFPQLANPLYYEAIQAGLGPATRQALNVAASPQEWNTFLLSSPEWMNR